MSYQNWAPLVINKSNSKPVKRPTISEESIKARKIEEETYVLPKVSVALQQQIKDARAKKGLTQKDLAARLNLKTAIINGYEAGTIIPDNSTIQKLSRALDVNLKLK